VISRSLFLLVFLLPISLRAQEAEYGKATYYADRFHGRSTASGELYHSDSLTAAHPTHPFGTLVCVTNMGNKTSVIVRINDRGPFIQGRIIDLSRKAMKMLRGLDKGVIYVSIEKVNDNNSDEKKDGW
jgi:rare lipoprotein A